jgi:hypothetical protein
LKLESNSPSKTNSSNEFFEHSVNLRTNIETLDGFEMASPKKKLLVIVVVTVDYE